jgi:hypothetical protein
MPKFVLAVQDALDIEKDKPFDSGGLLALMLIIVVQGGASFSIPGELGFSPLRS